MSVEGLDCWDNFPMEHGCVCGNDCPPPPQPLDPRPWVNGNDRASRNWMRMYYFAPRPGYSQNPEDYS